MGDATVDRLERARIKCNNEVGSHGGTWLVHVGPVNYRLQYVYYDVLQGTRAGVQSEVGYVPCKRHRWPVRARYFRDANVHGPSANAKLG